MFGRIGFSELLIVLAIALVIFGPKHLPKLGKTLGSAIKGFRDGVDGDDEKNTTNSLEG